MDGDHNRPEQVNNNASMISITKKNKLLDRQRK